MAKLEGAHQPIELVTGTCLRCGAAWTGPRGGRPRKWCSTACRRAAYEERRAAVRGAIAVREVVRERIVSNDHDLTECANRVSDSPAACRRVLKALEEANEVVYGSDPRWDAVRQLIRRLWFERDRSVAGRTRGYW